MSDQLHVHALSLHVPDRARLVDARGFDPLRLGLVPIERGEIEDADRAIAGDGREHPRDMWKQILV